MAFEQRKNIILSLIIVLALVYVGRLFYLQVINKSYQISAENNVLRFVTEYPERGLIYDRNHKLLVFNKASYDLMVIPNKIKNLDTTELCNLVHFDKKEFTRQLKKAKKYSGYKPSVIIKLLDEEEFSALQEQLFRFHGFYLQRRLVRSYTDTIASHLLGYIGEVSEKQIKADPYYVQGDYIGISGIENFYESKLRGKKGVSIYQVDVHNRIKDRFADGKYDTLPEKGKDLTITIDRILQHYGEYLLQGKIGSIVAVEPATGEVLAFVSSPTYNPNMLISRNRSKYYKMLITDSLKPLFNRALMSKYPPGSTFKVANALVGQEEEILFPNTYYSCHYGYHAGGLTVGCHGHKSPLNLIESIQISCNAYYCNVFRNILEHNKNESVEYAFKIWRHYITSLGFGSKLGIDLPNESSGFIPTTKYFDKFYGRGHWSGLTVISMAIGQGEVLVTPLQLANFVAIIANKGYYKIPHVVKAIKDSNINISYQVSHYTDIKKQYFEVVTEGMYLAVNGGAGATAHIAKIQGIDVCGKTGTAQNPHGKDHSVFMAFAPRQNPKIAIAVVIENGGYGATIAAPIARLMIEKYLNDSISRPYLEKYVLEKK